MSGPKRSHVDRDAILGQMGLMSGNSGIGADDGGDADLEAELRALQQSEGLEIPEQQRQRPRPRKPATDPTDLSYIQKMALESTQDIDDNISDVDENDEDLMADLQALAAEERSPSPPPAPKPTELPHVRHVAPPLSHAAPALPHATPPRQLSPKKHSSDAHREQSGGAAGNGLLPLLQDRLDMYRKATTAANAANEASKVRRYNRAIKTLEQQLKSVKTGKAVSDSDIPPPVAIVNSSKPRDLPPVSGGEQMLVDTSDAVKFTPTSSIDKIPSIPSDADVPVKVERPPPREMSGGHTMSTTAPCVEPASVLEALEQRLAKYASTAQKANEEGNASKARRIGRIVSQYQTAIKSYKAGKPVNYDELPAPPCFPDIPRPDVANAANAPKVNQRQSTDQPSTSSTVHSGEPAQSLAVKSTPRALASKSPSKSPQSAAGKQLLFLSERQKLFRHAAVEAKSKGQLDLAKKYLKISLQLEQMVQASKNGLPVDVTQVPEPPSLDVEVGKKIAGGPSHKTIPTGNREKVYAELEQDLLNQMRLCKANSQTHVQMGNVVTASRFDKMVGNVAKDIEALRNSFKRGDPVPRFHYETRQFSIVESCLDLGDNDLEIVLVRGIQLPLPSGYSSTDLDTYLKYEFPFPNDEPQKGESEVVKGNSSPVYNEKFKVTINRKSRVFARVVKTKSVKLEMYYRRGFLKSDKVLGTISVELAPLESKCEHHGSFDLMDGRKKVGGKLEVKLRIREPLYGLRQVQDTQERWLVIDGFEGAQATAPAPVDISKRTSPSLEVLKYERDTLEKQIASLRGRLTEAQVTKLKQKSSELDEQMQKVQNSIRSGGLPALKEYLSAIEHTAEAYQNEAVKMLGEGRQDRAQVMLQKKKIIENEVTVMNEKLRQRGR